MNLTWIAVDWGTTNFRAFLMQEGETIEEKQSNQGILAVPHQGFEQVLLENIQPWLAINPKPLILMSGMIGSQQGWHEVPYQPLPVMATQLAQQSYRFLTNWGNPIHIIPGVNGLSDYDLPDVMRGEETQLIGLGHKFDQDTNHIILPGTHSKHCVLQKDKIETFTSFMTGELYAMLLSTSIIGKALPTQIEDDNAFLLGVDLAKEEIPFSHLIFSARTKRLNQEIKPEFIGSYLSGLLIGYELRTLQITDKIWVISNQKLGERYVLAGTRLNLNLQHISGTECFLQGMRQLQHYLREI